MILLALAACVSTPADTGDTAADTDDTPAAAADGSVPLGDANNFAYVGTLDAPAFAVAERADVSLSWERLVTDLRCHGLDPVADIDNTALLVFPYLTEEEVERGLSEDTMEQADLGVYLSYAPGDATSVSLSQMSFFGTDADIEAQFTADSGTWLVLLTTGTSVAVGTRMLAFLTPTVDATAVTAEVDDGCAILDFSADLASLTPVPVLRDGPWRLDWSALTKNGQGGAFVPTRVDGLMVARFDETPAELEADFLDLELLAEETWSSPVAGGTSADLGAAGFPGFHADGTWALALTCSTCPNPAPLFLTLLEPG